uniref:Uncharacterized protein n=1 Tax=Arundo donax TaxID=35708 RepID=A0A0A9D3I9_ARUDO
MRWSMYSSSSSSSASLYSRRSSPSRSSLAKLPNRSVPSSWQMREKEQMASDSSPILGSSFTPLLVGCHARISR